MGEYYYKKPPLFNWLLVLSYNLFGDFSECATRCVSPVSSFVFGLVLFMVGRKYVSSVFGFYASLAFLFSYEVIQYSSIMAEIDMFYSLVIFSMLISIFHFYEQKKYYALFIIVYILAIIGFLTKGLITLLFLIISLLVFFHYNKDLNKLWSRYHCIGLALFLAVIAGYYGWYARYNSLA